MISLQCLNHHGAPRDLYPTMLLVAVASSITPVVTSTESWGAAGPCQVVIGVGSSSADAAIIGDPVIVRNTPQFHPKQNIFSTIPLFA